jgi:predicted dehydrogenase
MTIGIAVVGAGRWGPHLIRNFTSDPRSDVKWVVDVDPARRDAILSKFPGQRVTHDFDGVIHDGEVQAVVIATPSSTHYRLVAAALEAEKHVLVEKPLASRLDDATKLVDLARGADVHLMVGHVFLFNDAVIEAGKLIGGGEMGKIYYLSMLRTNLGPVRHDANAGWDLASHDISIANQWLKSVPEKVSAIGGSFLNPGIEDVVFGTLFYPAGEVVHVHASWLNPRKSRFITAVGSNQMLTVNDMDMSEPLRVYDKGVQGFENPIGEVQDTFAQFRSEIRDGQVTIPHVTLGEPLAAECRSFLDRILGSGDEVSDGITGLNVVRVLDAMDRSIAAGSQVVEV